MGGELAGKKVAILLSDGFEQVEMTEPKKALEDVGVEVTLIAPEAGPVQGFNHHDKADQFDADMTLEDAEPDDFDALHLPGGVINGDALRIEEGAQEFVKAMQDAGKPIAVICHGGWVLISADLVKGRKVTSWPTLQDDFRNAGADWVDQEVVVDGNWVSSRKPDDIPSFNSAMIELLQKAGA